MRSANRLHYRSTVLSGDLKTQSFFSGRTLRPGGGIKSEDKVGGFLMPCVLPQSSGVPLYDILCCPFLLERDLDVKEGRGMLEAGLRRLSESCVAPSVPGVTQCACPI